MSLVAYESSDSDNDEDEKKHELPLKKGGTFQNTKKETVKISIPSLEQFKEEPSEENKQYHRPTFKSGSGLFSMLPPPKYSTLDDKKSFVPHVLSKKKEITKPAIQKPLLKSSSDAKSGDVPYILEPDIKEEEDDLEEDEELRKSNHDKSSAVDYFSLAPSTELTAELGGAQVYDKSLFSELPQPSKAHSAYDGKNPSQFMNSSLESHPCITSTHNEASAKSSTSSDMVREHFEADSEDFVDSIQSSDFQATNAEESFMNDEGFQRLTGRREKEQINLIDVKADDQMVGREEWLLQSLTEERAERPSKRRHGMPTQQQKRKHQITYLAYQAKERELDLKNQWSLNSRTRRETQAKYGF